MRVSYPNEAISDSKEYRILFIMIFINVGHNYCSHSVHSVSKRSTSNLFFSYYLLQWNEKRNTLRVYVHLTMNEKPHLLDLSELSLEGRLSNLIRSIGFVND